MNDYEEILSETIDSVTDNIRTQLNKAYMYGHERGKKSSCDCKEDMEAEYNRGLNDAWKAQRKIIYDEGLSMRELMQIFGTESYEKILKENTASEAIAKIKEYEKQQKQDTIQVGDEVITKFGTKGIVITDVPSGDGKISVWLQNFTHVQLYPVKDLSKTGRHFDAIAEVLEERNKYV